MKRFVCTVCGYVHEGENPPEECPVCHQPSTKFREEAGTGTLGEKKQPEKKPVQTAEQEKQEKVCDVNFTGWTNPIDTWKRFIRWR